MSLGVLAVLGLAGGIGIDGHMPVWRVAVYLALAVLAYLHGRHVAGRYGWQVLAGVAVVGGAVVAVVDVTAVTSVLSILAVAVVLPWLAGRYVRQQAVLAETERERVADQARLAERGRLAAELHDSLGHELALIALRAGALELSAELSKEHRQLAGGMRASAVAATDRLRQSIATLRERDDVPPVGDLVDGARAAGMTVEVSGLVDLPDLVDQAVRRVARESLTNAAKHAPGQPVTMALDVTGHVVTLTVANAADARTGTGSGLISLRERLRLIGGRLDVDTTGGRFTLTARVPLT